MSNLNSLDRSFSSLTPAGKWLLRGTDSCSEEESFGVAQMRVSVCVCDDDQSGAQNTQKYKKLGVVFLCFISPGYTVYS